MAFFPRSPGDLILSDDWNAAMTEVVRLGSAKLDTTGGTVSGPLSVQSLNVGTLDPPNRPLTVRGAAGTFLNVIANNGAQEVLFGADAGGGIVSVATNHDLQLRTGNVTRLTVKADGKVGIGTTSPQGALDVNGAIRAGTSEIYFTQTNHNHTGIGNAPGFAAIENGADHNTLMILGRTVSTSPLKRSVSVWDELNVHGTLTVQKGAANGNVILEGDLYLRKTGDGYARFTQETFPSWLFYQESPNNLKLIMAEGPLSSPIPPWEFAIGSKGVGGSIPIFFKFFKVNQRGDLWVGGSISASGGKAGYVVDNFINAVGETLEQGDVLVVGGKPASYYYGVASGIPVPEVDLTNRAYDTRVCGIVDSVVQADSVPSYELPVPTEEEVRAAQSAKSAKGRKAAEEALAARLVNPLAGLAAPVTADLNTKQVQAGQLGKMVTLGAYAWCKVDADIAPIALGDLLTTSPTRGHAQKVTEPGRAIGAILGKALGALESGKGKIPVLVSLH